MRATEIVCVVFFTLWIFIRLILTSFHSLHSISKFALCFFGLNLTQLAHALGVAQAGLSLSLCISPSSTISFALSQSAGSGSGVWDWAAATVAPHVAPSRLLNGLFYYVDYYWRFFFSFFSGFCGYLIWLCSLGELCVEFLLISLTPQWLKIKCMRCV